METSFIMPTSSSEPTGVCPYVSDGLLLRVGGLPISGADRLKGSRLAADLARSCSLQLTLSSLAQGLSGLLHTAVSQANGNPALQHALLAVRRSVFNGRRPAGADWELAAANLDSQARATLNRWGETKDDLENHHADAEQRLQQSVSEGRKELRQLVCFPDFRKGLLLSSPSFERTLEDYVRSGSKPMDRKLRRTERTLLSYLFRTTHKTSPFSTLTPVCLVHFTGDARHPATPNFESREVRCAAKPNVGILSRVAQAITQNVLDYPQLRLTVQDGAEVSGNRVKYWKRTETPIAANGPVHSRVTEHKFTIHLTPSLELLLSLIRERGPMRVADIQDALTSCLQLTANEAAQYTRILVENGFLVVAGVRQSIFDRQYWSRFAHELASMDDPSLNEIARGVKRIQQQTKEFETADLPVRPKLLQSVELEAMQLLQSARSAASLPTPVLYEDARASCTALSINKDKWREPLSNLAELQRLFSLFDPLLISKVSLKSIFKKKYRSGICRDVLDFSDYFHEAFYRPYQQATAEASKKRDHHNPFGGGVLNPLRLPEITAILDARAKLSMEIEEQLASPTGAGEIELSSECVESIGADMLRRHRLLSNSFFFQAAGNAQSGDRMLAVLNHVYGGLGCMYTRFSHLFAESGQHSLEELLRSNLSALQTPDTLFAEFQGGHETNLNQHGLLADAEIVHPGERGIAPPDKQIHVSEIDLRYDSDADEVYLFCRRLGKRIVPLYLGSLYPLVLPELQTLFLHFSPPTVLHSELAPKQFPAGSEVLSQPRIRYKQVVIERAKWTINTGALPKRTAQEKDFEYLLRLYRWRNETGIPVEVFAKFIRAESTEQGSPDERGAALLAGPQKPFFVDFENPFCVSLFEKLISETQGCIRFTEMLPSGRNAMLTHNGDAYVSECVVEITQSC